MNPTAAAIDQVQKMPTGGDPVLELVKWALVIMLLVAGAAVPAMLYARKVKKDKNEGAVETAMSDAGSALFNHLSQQVTEYRAIADKAYTERNALFDRVAKLEAKSDEFQKANESLDRLKTKLEIKDVSLAEKDGQIRELIQQASKERAAFMGLLDRKDAELSKANERILALEQEVARLSARLSVDEANMTRPICPFHGKTGDQLPAISHDEAQA